jgi:hypothetical protein
LELNVRGTLRPRDRCPFFSVMSVWSVMYEVARLPCRFVNIGEFSAFLISLSREPRHYSPERVIVANDQWRVVVMLSGRK